MIEEVHQYGHKKGESLPKPCRRDDQPAISLRIFFPGLGLEAKRGVSLRFKIITDYSKTVTICYFFVQCV